jgi:NADPH-dependent glutamate synthase beta subunit-like oxidoreductase
MEFQTLYSKSSINTIDNEFLECLNSYSSDLYNSFLYKRVNNQELDSASLIDLSMILQGYIIDKFNLAEYFDSLKKDRQILQKIYELKRNFIHRVALKKFSKDCCFRIEAINLMKNKNLAETDEKFLKLYEEAISAGREDDIIIVAEYAAYRVHYGEQSLLFSKPNELDYDNLVGFKKDEHIIYKNPSNYLANENKGFFESSYCIKCHKTSKDSCSKGLEDEKKRINLLGNILSGCPLRIKISEMNLLYESADLIASLAILTTENPLACLTGKRICNDCSKACIFQKQDPVDIPLIESKLYEEVLNIDYGFEIYSLLARWMPLDTKNYRKSNKEKGNVLVVGAGPSGIALSHYLLKARVNVCLIDGQKIEPISEVFKNSLIKNYKDIKKLYNDIKPQGFGGVAEFGITDRWNKENLIVARLLLERCDNFQMVGGVRFSSNITYEDAKGLGFDHVALCCGSNHPNVPNVKGSNLANVRTASDFLMSLGSGGAHFNNTKTDFFVKFPVVVIGAGLTAIDAAVETLKYYPVLCKKIANKIDESGLVLLSKKDIIDYEIIIRAAKLYKEEDIKAKQEKRNPDYSAINKILGGVKIIYRKDLIKSPAYRLNHEEVQFALEEGVEFIECSEVLSLNSDEFGSVQSITIEHENMKTNLKAGTVLIAAGTSRSDIQDFDTIDDANISIYGDMNKKYTGSVVKAIASAKNNYQDILSKINAKNTGGNKINLKDFLEPKIKQVIDHKFITEIIIENKMLAKNLKPGQFFKLLNYSNLSQKSFEPLAIHGCLKDGDMFSLFIKNAGNSSRLASYPEIKNSTILLISQAGYYLSLYDYVKFLKENNNKVILAIEFNDISEFIYKERVLKHLDECYIFLLTDSDSCENTCYIYGDLENMLRSNINIEEIHELVIALENQKSTKILQLFENIDIKKHVSLNIPMQCMMGGICGQCMIIRSGKDGKNTVQFACKKHIDEFSKEEFESSSIRLSQNSLLNFISSNIPES